MNTMIERTTKEQYPKELISLIKNETAQLLVLKCIFTYPEYTQRIKTAKINASNEAKMNRYSAAYANAFVVYRVDVVVREIHSDMKSALEILTARLRFTQPELLNSPSYTKLKQYVSQQPEYVI